MKITIDTQTIQDPNAFGEVLRDYVFDCEKWELGCYTSFDLIEGFDKCEAGTPEYEEAFGYLFGTNKTEYVQMMGDEPAIHVHTKDDIMVAWWWDGDGTLVIKEGDRIAINDDCKKCYGWDWVIERPHRMTDQRPSSKTPRY